MDTKIDDISPPCCGNCACSRLFKHASGELSLTCNYDPPKVTAVAIPDPSGVRWLTNTSFPPVMKEFWCFQHTRQKH